MSILTRLSSESNRYSAIDFASWVFPTPVGPRKRNEPMGRAGSLMPARFLCIALVIFPMASSCPIIILFRASPIPSSLAASLWATFTTGIPVVFEMTAAMSSSVTTGCLLFFLVEEHCSLTMEPASSIASMALSGRHLSVMYLSDSFAHASSAFPV